MNLNLQKIVDLAKQIEINCLTYSQFNSKLFRIILKTTALNCAFYIISGRKLLANKIACLALKSTYINLQRHKIRVAGLNHLLI